MDYAQQSRDLFLQGYNCAQAVFAPFASLCGLDTKQALVLAAPFGAGIGRMRETCGAFCGLTLLCGALKGNDSTDAVEREPVYALVQRQAEAFRREFGTLICRELLGLDPSAGPESARPSVRTPGWYDKRPCERCVVFCAQLGASMLQDGGHQPGDVAGHPVG